MKNHINLGILLPISDLGPVHSEGIMRLLGFLLPHWVEDNTISVTIACATWVREELEKHFLDLGADLSKVTFITARKNPFFVVRVIRKVFYASKKDHFNKLYKPRKRNFAKLIIKKIVGFVVYRWWALCLFLPVIIVFGTLYSLFYTIQKLVKKIVSIFSKLNERFTYFLSKDISKVTNKTKARLIIYRIGNKFYSISPRKFFEHIGKTILNLVSMEELRLLNRKILGLNDIDCWFFPFPRYAAAFKVKTPKVVSLPDLVHLDFPTRFLQLDENYYSLIEEISDSLKSATKVITYSNYVCENHVVKNNYAKGENVVVINHAPIDLSSQIAITNSTSSHKGNLRTTSLEIIQNYVRNLSINENNYNSEYIAQLPFEDIKYFFISSQNRPHKNYLNTIKAYEKLLREQYINAKLLVTGDLYGEVLDYINARRLHLDVLSLHALPAKVHAAFYACAELTLAPSLFEGGFPFVFSESLSLNTPVLLSDIPVVREVLPSPIYDQFIFDPYSIQDIVSKVSWAMDNRTELLTNQKKILRKMKNRTWENVADEYSNVFKQSCN